MRFEDIKKDFERRETESELHIENKLRLNLSTRAHATLLNDIEAFCLKDDDQYKNNKMLSRVINHIFTHYRETAKASAALALSTRKAELEALLATVQPTEARNAAIQLFLSDYRHELENNIKHRIDSKGFQCSIRLNRNNMAYLISEDAQQESEFYGGKVGRYVKTVVEEYTDLSFAHRERIYLREILNEISLAIAEKKLLKLIMHSKKVPEGKGKEENVILYVKPLEVRQDSEMLYNYLIGLQSTSKEGPWIKGSVRLTFIKECTHLAQSGFISLDEAKSLRAETRQKGVQYLSSNAPATKVTVQFTTEGLRLYNRLLHLRPLYLPDSNPDKLVYKFECTEFQAETYFFKFGHNVQILEPKSLADKFLLQYQLAAKAYLEQHDTDPKT